MCNPFSGHISFDAKDFGKVYFLSKLHHDEDRMLIPHENIIAWETQNDFDYSSFKFSHSCGKEIDEKTKQALMELLISWGKTRNALEDFKSICVFKKQDGSEIKDLVIDLKHKTIATKEDNCIISVMFDGFTFNTNSDCTFTTGSYCTFNTNSYCTFTTSYNCTFTTGYSCTFTTGYSCTFNTGDYCTFTTGYSCTFKTSYNCTFATDSNCTFATYSGCTFTTGYDCTFTTDFDCTFTTSSDCVVIRRDIFQVIKLKKGKTIKLNGYNIKGYKTIKKGETNAN